MDESVWSGHVKLGSWRSCIMLIGHRLLCFNCALGCISVVRCNLVEDESFYYCFSLKRTYWQAVVSSVINTRRSFGVASCLVLLLKTRECFILISPI